MKVTPMALAGVLLLEMEVFRDRRGYFQEVWNPERASIPDLDCAFVQDNIAFSHHGVLRGLHFQDPFPQAKLIIALSGAIYDVAVDIRRDSPTFARWVSSTLTAGSGQALYVPKGFAHGYQVISEHAQILYKCTDVYHPEAEHTIAWNDPHLRIDWPIAHPILSAKDQSAPPLEVAVGVPAFPGQ